MSHNQRQEYIFSPFRNPTADYMLFQLIMKGHSFNYDLSDNFVYILNFPNSKFLLFECECTISKFRAIISKCDERKFIATKLMIFYYDFSDIFSDKLKYSLQTGMFTFTIIDMIVRAGGWWGISHTHNLIDLAKSQKS